MGGDHYFDDDNGASAIASEWGVSVDLLNEADWELETRDGNDGELYGYFVRFDESTDPDILKELGLAPDEFVREVSLNAFERLEPEDPNENLAYLAREYIQLGGANGAVRIADVVLLSPWSPSTPQAQEFWDKNIGQLPVEDRQAFLVQLLRYS